MQMYLVEERCEEGEVRYHLIDDTRKARGNKILPLPCFEMLDKVLGIDINAEVARFSGRDDPPTRRLISYSNEQGRLMHYLRFKSEYFKAPVYDSHGRRITRRGFLRLAEILESQERFFEQGVSENKFVNNIRKRSLDQIKKECCVMVPCVSSYNLPTRHTLDVVLGIDVEERLNHWQETEAGMKPIRFERGRFFCRWDTPERLFNIVDNVRFDMEH